MNFNRMPPGWKEKLDRAECPRCPGKRVRIISQDEDWISLLCEGCKGGYVFLTAAAEARLAGEEEKVH